MKNDRTNRAVFLMEASYASTLSRSFSPLRNGVLAAPVRLMWLRTASSGFLSPSLTPSYELASRQPQGHWFPALPHHLSKKRDEELGGESSS
jgi:hypothetical protein